MASELEPDAEGARSGDTAQGPLLLDRAMASAGPFGLGQFAVLGFMGFTWMLLAFSFSLPIFIAADPDRTVASCPPASALPKGGNPVACEAGVLLPHDAWCDDSLRPYWHYAQRENLITAEWDLICGARYLAASAGGAFFFGFMSGNLAFSPVPDRIGRCLTYIAGVSIAALGAGLCAHSWSYSTYLAGRFILGMGQGGVGNVAYVSATEVVGKAYTSAVMVAMMCMWSGGMLLLVLLTLFTEEWRVLSSLHFFAHLLLLAGSLCARYRGLQQK